MSGIRRCGVGDIGTAATRAEIRSTTANHVIAPGGQRDLLCPEERLPMADAAEGVPFLSNRVRALPELATDRHLDAPSGYPAGRCAGSRRSRSRAERRDHRQPDGPDHRAGRRPGYNGDKKIRGRKRHLVVCCSSCAFIRPAFRIETAPDRCLKPWRLASPSSSSSGRMA